MARRYRYELLKPLFAREEINAIINQNFTNKRKARIEKTSNTHKNNNDNIINITIQQL